MYSACIIVHIRKIFGIVQLGNIILVHNTIRYLYVVEHEHI